MGRGVVRENQLLINRQYHAVSARIDRDGNWEARKLPVDVAKLLHEKKKRYALAALALTDFAKMESRTLWVQARIAVAIERFRRAQGSLPKQLDALVPAYLPELPADPMDGGPMRYAADSAETFRLWSIADDHEDDRGAADREAVGAKLDWVWPGLEPGK